jgi:flavin reductase (DIM6/NTAB) family NADH-FMN oxidoreductase RutF
MTIQWSSPAEDRERDNLSLAYCRFFGAPAPSLSLSMSVTQAEFRKALGSFATGITVITLDSDDEVHGMTANAFTSVSLDPMLVLVCVDQRASTHAHLHAKKRFGVNVLAENQRAISEYYANPERTHDRAAEEAGATFERTKHGTPVLRGALAYLECRLHTAQDAGDHTIFIAEVEDVVVGEGSPLLYFGSNYRAIGSSLD